MLHDAKTTPDPSSRAAQTQVHQYTFDLNLGFDRSSSPSPETSPNASLRELETHVQQLRTDAAEMHELVPLQHSRPISSSTGSSSSNTLDEDLSNDDACIHYGRSRPISEARLAEWRFDMCRWIRTAPANAKPKVLHRTHTAADGRKPPQSPLYKLNRPALVTELLTSHAESAEPIAEFMARHPSLEQFERHVMRDAHTLPKAPRVAPVNDPTTQNLPPLAAEEYATHVSRLTYLVRSLHAIERADPEFLSQTRVHLLLDLVMDLEHAFTLPRVEFLRRHAETVRAMSSPSHYYCPEDEARDTDCVVGCAEDWVQGVTSAGSPDAEHVKHMTHAIPRHPGFRRNTTNTSQSTHNAPSHVTRDTCILGNKLFPEDGFGFEMPDAQPCSSPRSSVGNSLDVCQFGTSQQHPAAYVAPSASFDPKLHPVVGPQSMEVLPALHVANANMSQTSSTQGKGLGSRRLRRRPQPGPELSPATSGGFSATSD
ncbi:hypothetical protein GGF43_003927 [Coemansia sp. RSA 2618]|nr:hypothetical protein GGF43_003927 [Coemansia sp. RSA 2618]